MISPHPTLRAPADCGQSERPGAPGQRIRPGEIIFGACGDGLRTALRDAGKVRTLPELFYGAEGTWRGAREKAPAAICRKVP
jgi:hypothetical protein